MQISNLSLLHTSSNLHLSTRRWLMWPTNNALSVILFSGLKAPKPELMLIWLVCVLVVTIMRPRQLKTSRTQVCKPWRRCCMQRKTRFLKQKLALSLKEMMRKTRLSVSGYTTMNWIRTRESNTSALRVERRIKRWMRPSRERKSYMTGRLNNTLKNSNMPYRTRRCKICRRMLRDRKSTRSTKRRLKSSKDA